MDITLLKSEPSVDELLDGFESIIDEVARTEVYLGNLYRSMGYIKPARIKTIYGVTYLLKSAAPTNKLRKEKHG
jgi:hypothetical protein